MPTTREPQTKGIYGDCALGSLRERERGGGAGAIQIQAIYVFVT